jgi:hypothetical protein
VAFWAESWATTSTYRANRCGDAVIAPRVDIGERGHGGARCASLLLSYRVVVCTGHPVPTPTTLSMDLDQILDKLIADVEMSIHGFYRGEVRQDTQRVRSARQRGIAREALVALMASSANQGAPSVTNASGAPSVTPEELAAITRCVIAWLPMGAPSTTSPQSRCLPAARELAPSWGEREKAQAALKRLTQ